MSNPLYPDLHHENLNDFLKLLAEAEEFDENQTPEEDPAEDLDPGQMQEDDIFQKVKEGNEEEVDTNAYEFLGRLEDGSYSGMDDITNPNDSAIRGLTAIIAGDIITNSENAVDYITVLFNNTGLNDMSPEDFKKVKGTIWKKLDDVTGSNPELAFSAFQKFVLGLVNDIRKNSGSSDAIDELT